MNVVRNSCGLFWVVHKTGGRDCVLLALSLSQVEGLASMLHIAALDNEAMATESRVDLQRHV